MTRRNQLLFLIISSAVLLPGCGSLPTASVTEAQIVTAAKAPPAKEPSRRTSEPAYSSRPETDETDMLFHALMAAGVDYRNGGKSYQTGFDCSGLVAHVYKEAYGLSLPHNTKAQSELGEPIEPGQLRPGDLVFFNTLRKPYSHVGIYVGEGRFIHAPRQGAVVRTENMKSNYWSTRFDGARRLAPAVIAVDFQTPPKKPLVTRP